MYKYEYTALASPEAWQGIGGLFAKSESESEGGKSVWWARTYKQSFIPPVSLTSKQFLRYLEAHGWKA